MGIKIQNPTPSSTESQEAQFKINDTVKKHIDEMRKQFENETTSQHILLKMEKHFEKATEILFEISKGLFTLSNKYENQVILIFII
jgi:hypothetical protein